MGCTVKAVADMAGVSIRALHHYDRIGLLKPALMSSSGYRIYTDADLERLQQVLFFRELGVGLQLIKEIIDSPGFDRKEALIAHRQLLIEKQMRLKRLVESVDRTIEAIERGIPLEARTMFEGFDAAKIAEYTGEARAKWGSKSVDESVERTSKYTKADWELIQSEGKEIERGMAALMDRTRQIRMSRHWWTGTSA